MRDLRIIVTGVGSIVGSSIVKNYKVIKERKIYVVGVDIKNSVSNKYLDKYYQYKKPADNNYIKKLLDICQKEKIDFIIPLVDEELIILAQNKKLFAKRNITVCINDPKKIELVQNKFNLYKYLEKMNIEVPESYLFKDSKELLNKAKKLGFPKKEICYKPTRSSGSRGFKIIKNDINYEDFLFNQKPNSKYITMEYLVDTLNKCKNIPETMVMEYVEGDLYNVNVLASKGQTLYAVAGKVLDFALGNTIKCQIENNKEVLDYCSKIVEALELDGNVGLEVAYDSRRVLKLIEINIRVQGQIYSSTLAGINFPYLELKYYLREELPKNIEVKEIIMARYLEDIKEPEEKKNMEISILKDKRNNNYIKNINPYIEYKEKIENDVLKLYYQYNHLKNIYRQGWLTTLLGLEHEKEIESVADHSWSVALLAITIIEKYHLNLNQEKCMKLALIHEIGEVYAGDIIPGEMSEAKKHNLEEKAVDELLNEAEFENDFKELWQEYNNKKSAESVFIKQVDKLETALQSISYGLNPSLFHYEDIITIPCLREIMKEVLKISKE